MKASKEIYKNLMDNLYDGVYLVDKDRKITYWNKGAEKLTGYETSEAVGRRCSQNMLLHINDAGDNLCHKDCPLKKTLTDGKVRELDMYIHHKEGHRVPVQVRIVPIRDSANRIIGAAEIFSDNLSKTASERRIDFFEKRSLLDPLTQIAKRRGLEIQLTTGLTEMQKYGMQFGILFIDIDRFKKINKGYGQGIGDEVLKMIAKTLSNSLRPFDFIGRWGGEEFIAIILNVDTDTLDTIAERCRLLVEKSALPKKFHSASVTVSIGATMSRSGDNLDTVIKRAEQLMYRSKALGRNCITTKL
jgi:diguanylate cyclase (GGDEF)-like protein/PAS domain S-box-containing protein